MTLTPAKSQQSSFPAEMAFQGIWRTYQLRLLNRLDLYLKDKRLHIVAAPGSGKTVFGLEVIRRIDQPTLILAPTITIRDQWAARLVQHFLPNQASLPCWLSIDIRSPQLLTIATYQALHTLCSHEPEQQEDAHVEEDHSSPIEPGNGNGKTSGQLELPTVLLDFKTLVVDEAHHLKSEWWRTLTSVVKQLQPTIVALTATPPYDVSPFEWQRYEELCGPVDAEIAVPELVLQRDLCPHQDYVYLSAPVEIEQKSIEEFRASVNLLVDSLRNNPVFAAAIATHPWIVDPNAYSEEILEHPENLSSMVIYLNAVHKPMPPDALRLLGTNLASMPELDLHWLEILLTQALYADPERFKSIDGELKKIRHELLQIGAIERHKVVLSNPANHAKLLTTSKTKLHSIEEIVRIESDALQEQLRCVVLTDFIRKNELPQSVEEAADFNEIGAVPIFETLRRAAIANMRLAVLCGSLVIIPETAKQLLLNTALTLGIPLEDLAFEKLPHAPAYSQLHITGTYYQAAVRLITPVFEQGGITVLVGTKSLLGEGWDAPAINTLILASFVGSYVLSNQMRGRSIRIDPASPSKTANVWHLVCVELGAFGPGEDHALLTRRCSAFVGANPATATIENGTDRLALGPAPFTRQQIAHLNVETIRRALDRRGLQKHWEEALASGTLKQMTSGLKVEKQALPRAFILKNTITALLVEAALLFVNLLSLALRAFGRLRLHDPSTVFAIVTAMAAAASLPMAITAVWRFIRHRTPERSMQQVGAVLLEALQHEGSINNSADLRIYADQNPDGSVYCWLGGGTGSDQAIFLRALRETLRAIQNPRYLLATKRFLRFFREDYFAVPELLARKKEFAEIFAKKWNARVGPVQLIYTRTPEGRLLLLRARMNSLTSAFQKRTEHVSCWK